MTSIPIISYRCRTFLPQQRRNLRCPHAHGLHHVDGVQLADARHVAEGRGQNECYREFTLCYDVTSCHDRVRSVITVTAYVLRIVAELVGGPVLAEPLAHGAQPQVVQRPHLVVVL